MEPTEDPTIDAARVPPDGLPAMDTLLVSFPLGLGAGCC